MSRKQIFLDSFPAAFLVELVVMIRHAYGQAHDECESRWEASEARDLEPFLRRTLIEAGLALLVAKYPAEISISPCETAKKHHYRKVVGGGRVELTQSHVSLGESAPRRADFREELADHQFLLWAAAEQERADAIRARKTLLYAMVAHWASPTNRSELGEVRIQFVNKFYQVISEFDLLNHIANEAKKEIVTENVKDEVVLKLRTKKKTGESNG